MSDPTVFKSVFDSFPVLETTRFRLRQIDAKDAADVFRIYSDDAVTVYYDLDTFTSIEEAYKLINRQQDHFVKKVGLRWGITFKGEDKVIGTVGLIFKPEILQGGMGYDLARPYWRQGIMHEVLNEVVRYSFLTAGVDQIQALVLPGNVASIGLLEKLGFKEKGILEGFAFFKSKFHDLHNFILTKESYLAGDK